MILLNKINEDEVNYKRSSSSEKVSTGPPFATLLSSYLEVAHYLSATWQRLKTLQAKLYCAQHVASAVMLEADIHQRLFRCKYK